MTSNQLRCNYLYRVVPVHTSFDDFKLMTLLLRRGSARTPSGFSVHTGVDVEKNKNFKNCYGSGVVVVLVAFSPLARISEIVRPFIPCLRFFSWVSGWVGSWTLARAH